MAQTYTLEEAAQRLGLTVEDFKRKLKTEWSTVRSFRDGPTLRFRSADIDELARSLGEASDPGLPLVGGNPLEDSDVPLSLGEETPSKPKSAPRKPVAEDPLFLGDDEDTDDIMLDLDGGSSMGGPTNRGDSDVRLDLTPPAYDPNANQQTEEITLDVEPPRSGVLKAPSSVRLSQPGSSKSGGPKSAKIPGPDLGADEGSSEFELSLDADSDSFELNLNSDSSEEVALGGEPSDAPRSGKSGINLGKPADSGVSLEKRQPQDDDSDVDFELSLDAPGQSGTRLGGPRSGGKPRADSDSEFELSLDDNSGITDALAEDFVVEQDKGDIFETDFELPLVAEDESGSEVVAIESSDTDLENSDFDIVIDDSDIPLEDESASQVVLVDDDDSVDAVEIEDEAVVLAEDDEAPAPKSKSKRKQAVMADEDDVVAVEEDDDAWGAATSQPGEDDEPIRTGPAYVAPPRWGPLPALLLLPCIMVVLLGSMMGYEMVRSQMGYQKPEKPTEPLVRGMADQFGFKVND
jgi:hypothetical protein